MTVERFGVRSAANRAADRSQADYFRDELHRELEELDHQADSLHAELAQHVQCNRSLETFRTQGALRTLAVARRSVIDMLSALAWRFPADTSN
jgi:hypothetical protein